MFEANGTAERDAALVVRNRFREQSRYEGGDKAYDTTHFAAGCRNQKVTRHVAQTWSDLAGEPLTLVRRRTPDMPSVISHWSKQTSR